MVVRHATTIHFCRLAKSSEVKMLEHLSQTAASYGLKINFSKTKVLTRNIWSKGAQSVQIGDQTVTILDECASEKYLGRKLSIDSPHETELQNRLAAAWAAFHVHKSELCSSAYRIQDRVRLLNSVVTPVVLYGCSTWALTSSMERRLQTAWRRILRYVFRIHRRKSVGADGAAEGWVDFVRRSAHTVDAQAKLHGIEPWVQRSRRIKWRFAGHLARQTDGRWSTKLLEQRPSTGHGRCQGRPRTRWADQIEALAGGNWIQIASDTTQWASLEEGFVVKAFAD